MLQKRKSSALPDIFILYGNAEFPMHFLSEST